MPTASRTAAGDPPAHRTWIDYWYGCVPAQRICCVRVAAALRSMRSASVTVRGNGRRKSPRSQPIQFLRQAAPPTAPRDARHSRPRTTRARFAFAPRAGQHKQPRQRRGGMQLFDIPPGKPRRTRLNEEDRMGIARAAARWSRRWSRSRDQRSASNRHGFRAKPLPRENPHAANRRRSRRLVARLRILDDV